MGTSGLCLVWRFASELFGAPGWISEIPGLVAVVLFFGLSPLYLLKAVRYPHRVAAEFNHPVSSNFFGTVTIGTLLISNVLAPISQTLAEILWIIGALATFALAYVIISRLLRGAIDGEHAVPAWLIPGVGTLDIAVTGDKMPMAWVPETRIFCLAVGTVVALVFFTMIFARLIHHAPMMEGMMPSMLITVGPFGIGFMAYTDLVQRVDVFAAMLFYFGLFMFLVIAPRVFLGRIPFATSWWAVSFPLAVLTGAGIRYAAHVKAWPITAVASFLLLFLTAIVGVLLFQTTRLALRREE